MSILGIGLSLLGGGGIIGLVLALVPGAGPLIANTVRGAGAVLAAVPWGKIWWLFPIGAALAFGIYRDFKAREVEKQAAEWRQKAVDSHRAFLLEKEQFAIERVSLQRARFEIGENNRSIAAAVADLDRAKRDVVAADARNAKLAQSTDVQIAGLRAAAGRHSVPCTLSPEAKRELENQ